VQGGRSVQEDVNSRTKLNQSHALSPHYRVAHFLVEDDAAGQQSCDLLEDYSVPVSLNCDRVLLVVLGRSRVHGVEIFSLLIANFTDNASYRRAVHVDIEHAQENTDPGERDSIHHNGRHFGAAVKQYKKAIKLNSENASFHSNLGTAYFSEKDFEGATREYQRAMQIDPGIFDRQPSGGVSVKLITSNDLGHFHYVMAQMYGQRNNADRCRYYLSKANEEGYPIKDALHDSVFAGLRKDPEFVLFVRSLKNPN